MSAKKGMFLRTLWGFILLIFSFHSTAQQLDLFLWHASSALPPLVMAVRKGETPQEAALRYLQNIHDDEGLKKLLKRSPMPPMGLGEYRRLDEADFGERILLIANRPEDYQTQGNWRIASFENPFTAAKNNVYIVPFAGDAGLTASETANFIKKLDQEFPSWIAMGGDDFDYSLLGGSIKGSINVNTRRDRFEIQLLQKKISSVLSGSSWLPKTWRSSGLQRQDRLAAICRGAQIVGVLMGFELVTHIDNHGGHNDHPDQQDEVLHPLQLLATPRSVVASLTAEGPQDGNTYHHQCLRPTPGARLHVAAIAPDGCVEAFESANGHVVGFQWHPELMAQRSQGAHRHRGLSVMQKLANWLTPMKSRCRQILEPPDEVQAHS